MFLELEKHRESTALLTENNHLLYGELSDLSRQIYQSVGYRSLVFHFCTNTSASIAGYVGFINGRAVPVMLDAKLDAELAAHLVELYQPKFLWLPEARAREFSGNDVLHQGEYVLLSREVESPFSLHDDLALLMTTSGSTGSPKLVRQSYRNLQANTRSIIEYLGIDAQERAVTNLPMHYVYGLSIINSHLQVGASLVVTERTLFDREFWHLMREQEVTSFAGVPYTYAMLAKLRFFRMKLPHLKTLTQAGGKLDTELHQAFADWAKTQGKRFVVMYGAAEATARMGYLPPELSLDKAGSMGKAIPGGRFELVDESGNLISEVGATGELVYYGENVTMGYAESGADLARGDERQGRYETGDMARCDADGIYTIVGRRKRFLKIFGKRTNLEEVEHLLRQHFSVVELACAGQDDLMRIYTSERGIADEIVPYLAIKLGLHPSAFRVHLVHEIPKNAAGKVAYGELEHIGV
ncbi:MAG: AMP-dependent synthetase [Selenomonas ruminantium]|nr:AMP-dependent synthetase [Selenomonas ruminantium]